MERVRITRNLQGYKYLLVVALLFFAPMMIAFHDLQTLLPGTLLSLLCLVLLYYLHYHAVRIEFDDAGLYINSRKRSQVIAFEQVERIETSNILVNGLPMQKMTYQDLSGIIHTARFMPRYKGLDLFLKHMKSDYPQVKLED